MGRPEVSLPKKISEIIRRNESSGVYVDLENMAEFVEAPLVDACIKLWEKGVRTYSSNATLDAGDPAYVVINYDHLSISNRTVAAELNGDMYEAAQDGIPTKYVRFTHEIDVNTPPQEIADWAGEFAEKFILQSATWEHHFTLDEAYQQGIICDEDVGPEGVDIDKVIQRSGVFYSEQDNLIFYSQKSFNRFHQGDFVE